MSGRNRTDTGAQVNRTAKAHDSRSIFFVGLFLLLLICRSTFGNWDIEDVHAKAQAEIDSVIGKGLLRLPDWEDRPSLSYVEAVVQESLRWYPVAPLDDDVYGGYYIPKGATVIVNAWGLSRDPTKFPEREKFKPERFLQRKSQGHSMHLNLKLTAPEDIADAALWISIVSLLAVFRFEASPLWNPGPDGASVQWSASASLCLEELPCEIMPQHENFNPGKLAHLIGLAAL